MKISRIALIVGIFAALQLLSTQGFALTLGRVKGAALLGKELDLSVVVQFASDEDGSRTCFDADLSYGDTPLERSRFAVSAEAGSQPNTQLVRVYSAMPVDDAMVRLTLKAACGPKASRSYVLLSDVPGELATGVPALPAAVISKSVVAGAAGGKADGRDLSAGPAFFGSPANGQAKPSVPVPKVSKSADENAVSAPLRGASRSSAIDTSSKSRVEASAVVMEDLQKRVDEIAKRQAGSGNAEDFQKQEARIAALAAAVRELQGVTAKNQHSLQLVSATVEGIASQSDGLRLVYALLALLVLCVAALAYMVRRLHRAGFDAMPWRAAEAQAAAADRMPAVAAVANPPHAATADPFAVNKLYAELPDAVSGSPMPVFKGAQRHDSGFGAVAAEVTEKGAAPLPAAASSQAKPQVELSDADPSGQVTLRAINTTEMKDVRQQAEVFMALGQHDEAVRLLRSNIRDNADANPLVYLDLLKILHALSQPADFARYREEFNVQFTGRIPEYAEFLEHGNGLEAYEDICQQIVVLWPTEYTVDFIEQCLVRTPEDHPEQGMDLEAFRDLLLLYGVLKRLDQSDDACMPPFSASVPANSTLGAAYPVLDTQTLSPLPILPGDFGVDIELDIDLDFSSAPAPMELHGNLIDFDGAVYPDAGQAVADKSAAQANVAPARSPD